MRLNSSIGIVDKANKIVRKVGSREPEDIAEQLGIMIMPVRFTRQKGVYKVIERNRFIFIKEVSPSRKNGHKKALKNGMKHSCSRFCGN